MSMPSLFMSDAVDDYLAKVKDLDGRHSDEFGKHAGPILTGLSQDERKTLSKDIRSSRTANDVEAALTRARFTPQEISQ